jgi:transcriptional regulator with XRE-family HTH domain
MYEDTGSNDINIGAKLRAARREQNLSLRQLAAKAEVSASLLSQIENGKANPSVRSLYGIAEALSVPIDYFFADAADESNEQTTSFTSGTMTASELRSAQIEGAIEDLVGEAENQNERPPGPVLHASDRQTIELKGDVSWARLTARDEENVEFLEVLYQVGASSGAKMSHHSGREFGLILEGVLTLELGFERYELEPGDSIIFDSTTPHRMSNAGEIPMKAIWVVMAEI